MVKKKKKKRQTKRKNRSSVRVPPPIPVHASRGSDSICLLHSPPGKLHMEIHTGPKYKLPPSLRLGFPSLAGGLTPPFRPIAEGSTPCSGTSALAVLCPGPSARSSPCPPPPPAAEPQPLGRGQRVLRVMARQRLDPRPSHSPLALSRSCSN